MARYAVLFASCVGFSLGCSMEPPPKQQTIIGKTTQDVKEFDPKENREVSDGKIRADDPFLYALQAYGPMIETISKTHIDYALKLYQAEHDRFPKDYNEFMDEIIKKNNIKLPVLPAAAEYQYDAENHKLVIVKARAADDAAKPAP